MSQVAASENATQAAVIEHISTDDHSFIIYVTWAFDGTYSIDITNLVKNDFKFKHLKYNFALFKQVKILENGFAIGWPDYPSMTLTSAALETVTLISKIKTKIQSKKESFNIEPHPYVQSTKSKYVYQKQDDNTWWHLDETGDSCGPYSSENEAITELEVYIVYLQTDGKNLNITQALLILKSGKLIRWHDWPAQQYLKYAWNSDVTQRFIYFHKGKHSRRKWLFSTAHVMENKWEYYSAWSANSPEVASSQKSA